MELEDLKKKIRQKNKNLYVIVDDKKSFSKIKFSVSNETTLQRAQTLFTKEPITIQWIRSFKKDSIFFDIGANVGVYTLFAAIVSETQVFAFEPESSNYYTLMENIILNNLIDKISAYPIGLSNKTEFTSLFLNCFSKGGSHHMIGKSLDHNLKIRSTRFKQGIFSTTLDDLILKWKFPMPNYLKIDVDGIEFKIIEKSTKLLQNNNLHSILVEINPNRSADKKIIKTLLDHGFKFDQNQVIFSTRKTGIHKGFAEYLFFRNRS